MNKKLAVYAEKCVGCRLCELACSFEKTGEFNPTYARIRISVLREDASYVPVVCMQCNEAWCWRVCPSGAISRDTATGIVKIDGERCVGCRMCTLACPFGTITYFNPEGRAIKCDECNGKPECVQLCPTGAIAYEKEGIAARMKRKETAKKMQTFSKQVQRI
jgi:anaerobic carbon-monoxide dehydrogenase iron sulfur subunit